MLFHLSQHLLLHHQFSTAGGEDFPEQFHGKRVYTLASVYNGDAAEGEALLQPLRELGPLVTDFSGRMNYVDLQQLFDTLMPAGEYRCYWKARYLTELPDDMIDLAIKNAASAPSDNSISSLWNFGGATASVGTDETCLLYTSPSPRDKRQSRMPSSA